jgi:hypothetical protein
MMKKLLDFLREYFNNYEHEVDFLRRMREEQLNISGCKNDTPRYYINLSTK